MLVPIVGVLLFLLAVCLFVYEVRVPEELYDDDATNPENWDQDSLVDEIGDSEHEEEAKESGKQ